MVTPFTIKVKDANINNIMLSFGSNFCLKLLLFFKKFFKYFCNAV